MKEVFVYMLETLVCGGVLMLAYAMLLERRVRFAVCRAYLLAAVVAAAVIPMLEIPVWAGEVVFVDPSVAISAEVVSAAAAEPAGGSYIGLFFAALYAAGVLLALAVMAVQVVRMRRLGRGAERTRFDGFELVRVREKIASFSFFGTIYVPADTAAGDLPAIVAHEASHIAHRHSYERVAMELFKAAMWWNPFVWIAARRLVEVQEYEADRDVMDGGCDASEYVNTLLKHLFGYSPEIANGLRDSLTKKRLKMMTTVTGGRHALLRTAATFAVAAGLVVAFSFTAGATEIRYAEPAAQAPEGEAAAADGKHSVTVVSVGSDADGKLNGRVEGISVGKAGDGGKIDEKVIVIHGGKTSTDGRKPLIIVDGKPFEGKSLNELDVSTIASMTVLKDSTAVAAYGAEAADGAILIVTRKGLPDAAAACRTMPRFEGGDIDGFRRWVMSRIRYPEAALKQGIYGRVLAEITIDAGGTLCNVNVTETPHESLSAEVMRVLMKSPRWEAGLDGDGKPVAVKLMLPFDFACSTPEGVKRGTPNADDGDKASMEAVTVMGFAE